MFRNRKNSQKPDEELISSFKRSFPEVCPSSTSTATDQKSSMLGDTLLAQSLPQRPAMDGDEKKGSESTPNGLQDQWGMTPSLMDPNSFAFTSFASQPPGYYNTATPTAMGLNGPSQTTEMRTPNMQMNLLTPLSIPHKPGHESTIAHSTMGMDMTAFNPPYEPVPPQGLDAFGQPNNLFGTAANFLHRDPDFTMLEHSAPEPQPSLNGLHHLNNSTIGLMRHHESAEKFDATYDQSNENFRFHSTLRAATAMVKDPDEIPITYLNKGQAYTMTISDSDPMRSGTKPLKYRTYVRVSFEEEEQRSKPASCWQLWKEGRGSNEAHHRNGKLLAVEHVDPNQGGDGEPRHTQHQLQRSRFDGFYVYWTPNRLTGNAECAISVRFNFLSTDFSHSKGVKGIPVRLCAKTEVIGTGNGEPPIGDSPEVCYCKVKLFRDHGAERKLSNDIAHVKKLIEKYKQQIAQAELGSANLDKRKRSGSISGKTAKAIKHKRTWSLSESGKPSLEDDLQMKLESLKEMFSSTRSVSHLNLSGDPQDDPDLFPVHFDPSEEAVPSQKSWDSGQQNGDSTIQVLSPAASHNSFGSSRPSIDLKYANSQNSTGYGNSRHNSLDWSGISQPDSDSQSGLRHNRFLNQPVKVQRVNGAAGNPGSNVDGWFEAMDVDSDYQPPPDVQKKPKCCFYIRPQSVAGNKANGYYRAVYLSERSAQALTQEVAKKCQFDPSNILRAVCIRGDGINIVLDDDVVQELPEGQDMTVEFLESRDCSHDSNTDQDSMSPSPTSAPGLEMRLIF